MDGAAQKIMTQLESGLTGGQGVSYLFASSLGYDCLNPTAIVGSNLATVCTNLVDRAAVTLEHSSRPWRPSHL